jgi:hypothetical protein
MINVCTVSDNNYLLKGITLYESLLKTNSDFRLHYLCIDNTSFDRIKRYESDRLIVYNLDSIKNSILENIKENSYEYFCFTLASFFTNYLMNKIDLPIIYIDSDVYFHHSINSILDEINTKDICLFRHRQFDIDSNRPEGKFNVGVIYFKNTDIGKELLAWWSDAVLNKKYPHLSTCGDQKYLDEFLNICPVNSILIDGEIGHGAPWHWQIYDLTSYHEDGFIKWNNKKQKLIFTHFSQFLFQEDKYVPSIMHHHYTPLNYYFNNKNLKIIYDNYFNELIKTKKKYYDQ